MIDAVSQLGDAQFDALLKVCFAVAFVTLPFVVIRLFNWAIFTATLSRYPLVNPTWDEPTKNKFTYRIRDLLVEGQAMVST